MQRQRLSGNHKQSNKSWFDYEGMSEELASLCDETEMVLLLYRNGAIRFINERAAQKKFKVKASHLIGSCIWELLEPEAAEQRKAFIEQVVQSRVPLRFLDERRGRWLDNMVYPLFDTDEKVKHVLVLARDVTRFKKVEKKFQDINQKLKDLVREHTAGLEKKTEEMKKAEETVSTLKKDLEDLNATVRVLLQKEKEDIDQITEHAASNVKLLLLPHLQSLLKTDLNPQQKEMVKLICDELSAITSPFIYNVQSNHSNLSPKEIQIADLVRAGMTTKEIAKLCKVTEKTGNTHREHIREKLGLHNRKFSLRTHLLSLS